MGYEFFIIETNILINSSHLAFKLFVLILEVASISSNKYLVSSASFKAIPNFS
ncbi:hypothetical protein BH23BAC2_BH23BAC2_16020 [soil metagenome]